MLLFFCINIIVRTSQQNLLTLMETSIVELRFARRRTKFGWSPYRRSLTSNNRTLLGSAPGQLALRFRAPSQPPAYNWMQKNLVCGWDIMWQDYRMIPVESTDVVTVFPAQNQEDIDKWWAYFNMFLEKMSPQQKITFMNM